MLQLKSFQVNCAEDIAEGLSPALKKDVGEIKKEIGDELKEMKKVVVEEGRTTLAQELAGVKSSLSILSAKVA